MTVALTPFPLSSSRSASLRTAQTLYAAPSTRSPHLRHHLVIQKPDCLPHSSSSCVQPPAADLPIADCPSSSITSLLFPSMRCPRPSSMHPLATCADSVTPSCPPVAPHTATVLRKPRLWRRTAPCSGPPRPSQRKSRKLKVVDRREVDRRPGLNQAWVVRKGRWQLAPSRSQTDRSRQACALLRCRPCS